jgi:hypothetical protein
MKAHSSLNKKLLTSCRNFGPIYSRITKTLKFWIELKISRKRKSIFRVSRKLFSSDCTESIFRTFHKNWRFMYKIVLCTISKCKIWKILRKLSIFFYGMTRNAFCGLPEAIWCIFHVPNLKLKNRWVPP